MGNLHLINWASWDQLETPPVAPRKWDQNMFVSCSIFALHHNGDAGNIAFFYWLFFGDTIPSAAPGTQKKQNPVRSLGYSPFVFARCFSLLEP